jgi:hypothetical protein
MNTFDRNDAAELIEAATIDPETKIPVSSWDISQCLIEEGYISTFMRGSFRVEDRGREYFSSWDHNLFSETGYYAFAKPVGFADVTVTGIGPAPTQQDGEVKLVEFEARYDFKTVFGENAVPDCLTNLPIVKGTATATKFDDGWRIAFTRLPALEAQGLPEASNASQEPAAKADGQRGMGSSKGTDRALPRDDKIVSSTTPGTLLDTSLGKPLRKQLLDTLRPTAQRQFGGEIVFVVNEIRTDGQFAFLDISPVRPNGAAIQMENVAGERLDAYGQAILSKQAGRWRVDHHIFGATEVWWIEFCDAYPRSIMGSSCR